MDLERHKTRHKTGDGLIIPLDPELARMFRLAGKLDADERRTLDDMITSFLRRHRERDDRQS